MFSFIENKFLVLYLYVILRKINILYSILVPYINVGSHEGFPIVS